MDPDIIEQLFVQQDAAAHRPGDGSRDNLIRGMLGGLLDLAPGIGDVKGVAEIPGLLSRGQMGGAALSLAGVIPFLGMPSDVAKKFSEIHRVFARGLGPNISNPAVRFGDDVFFSEGAYNHTNILMDPEHVDTFGDNWLRNTESQDLEFGFLVDDGSFVGYSEAGRVGVDSGQLPQGTSPYGITSESFELTGEAAERNSELRRAFEARQAQMRKLQEGPTVKSIKIGRIDG